MSIRRLKALFVGLSFFACTSLFAAPLVVNIAGIESHGELGDAANTVLTYDVGANAHITAATYSVSLTAFDPSWLSELTLSFTDSAQSTGVFLRPGFIDGVPGSFSYTDSANLVDLGLDFFVGADGILRLEFFEWFDDFAGADGVWDFGTITFEIESAAGEVPEPASGLLIGAGLAAMGYAGRRRRAARAPGALAA